MRRALAVMLVLAIPGPLAAQQRPDHVRLGVAAGNGSALGKALAHFRVALAADSADYEANWRAAMALVDLGSRIPDSLESPRRDSLYARAEAFARRAVDSDSTGADGHFALAVAVGRASLSKSREERVRRAAEVRSEALKAIALAPRHDGAYHVLGRWNAEVMRLSGVGRFVARNLPGGAVFGQASWKNAITYMERAVRLDPTRIYHHLDLAEIYIDRKRWADARAELRRVEELPVTHVMDPSYKADAARLLRKIGDNR
jgi:tetratricopeptide (TPR) repeat protein